MSNATTLMILKHFIITVGSEQVKMDNGKHKCRVILQQADWWPSLSTPNRLMSIQIFTRDVKE